MDATLENIFDRYRIVSYFHYTTLFFYFPCGLTLSTIRFFIGFQAFLASVVFKKFPKLKCSVLRVMSAVLGFIVIEERKENYRKSTKVIVSNHVTNFDHLAVNLVRPCTVPSVWDLPAFLNWILGYTDFAVTEGRTVLIENVKNYIQGSDIPVLVFPEGATTNGKKGLLKFNVWPFVLHHSVQPILITIIQVPFLKISPSVIGSRWWSDMFWFLFVPFTIFKIRYCPVMIKHADEKAEDFANRVQTLMCEELGLQLTNYTSVDKVLYAKKLLCSSHKD